MQAENVRDRDEVSCAVLLHFKPNIACVVQHSVVGSGELSVSLAEDAAMAELLLRPILLSYLYSVALVLENTDHSLIINTTEQYRFHYSH